MTLNKEITFRLFNNLGVYPNFFGQAGITLSSLKLKEEIIINYEDESKPCSLWGGECVLDTKNIKVLLAANITSDYDDYLLTLSGDNNVIYGLSLLIDKKDDKYSINNEIFVIKENNIWKHPNMYVKLISLAASELFIHYNINWKPISEYSDLYQALKELSEEVIC